MCKRDGNSTAIVLSIQSAFCYAVHPGPGSSIRQKDAAKASVAPLTAYVLKHYTLPDSVMQACLGDQRDFDVLLQAGAG